MPGWLSEEIGGFATWQLPLLIVGAALLGWLATKDGGRDE